MPRSRKSPVQRYHDRVAARYDASYDDAFWQWHDTLTWDYLKPFLPKDLRAPILDLGCGTGKWTARILKSGFSVTCVDISQAMLEQARQKAEGMGMTNRVTFVQADLCDLSPLGKECAALAVALGDPIGCTRSPVLALKQVRRVLAPGGVLVATFDNRLAAIDHYVSLGDPRALARFLRDGRTHWLTRNVKERFDIWTFGPVELRRLLQSAGFDLLDMVGKTVLPMRHYRNLLETPATRRAWASIEMKLARDPFAMARASHLQVSCRACD